MSKQNIAMPPLAASVSIRDESTAYATLNINNQYTISDIKIRNNEHGLFVDMPKQRGYDLVEFGTKAAEREVKNTILNALKSEIDEKDSTFGAKVAKPTKGMEVSAFARLAPKAAQEKGIHANITLHLNELITLSGISIQDNAAKDGLRINYPGYVRAQGEKAGEFKQIHTSYDPEFRSKVTEACLESLGKARDARETAVQKEADLKAGFAAAGKSAREEGESKYTLRDTLKENGEKAAEQKAATPEKAVAKEVEHLPA